MTNQSASKPGGRQKGRAKTGGRRKGTPNRTTRELREAFQEHETKLVTALIDLTKSDDEKVRLGAIRECLDRGWGKPAQAFSGTLNADTSLIELMQKIDGRGRNLPA